uniref:Armadillo repeat containing 5 n=1 Tax=Stegastes partitus TaxID=144197 RepID=A0A3B4ZQF0_9TELE
GFDLLPALTQYFMHGLEELPVDAGNSGGGKEMDKRSRVSQWRALVAIRTQHIKGDKAGIARFRSQGGLRPLLDLLKHPECSRKTLDLALSILANCCTELETHFMNEKNKFWTISVSVDILKRNVALETVQNRAARALGNLAMDPESSALIHSAGKFEMLLCDICAQSAARALLYLSDTPSNRLSLLTQGTLSALAPLIAPEYPQALRRAALRTLHELTRSCGVECAREVSRSGVLAQLGVMASGESGKLFEEVALKTLANMCSQGCLRPLVGSLGVIQKFTEEVKRDPLKSGVFLKALCLCCKEAVNRAKVKESGGLEVLVGFLSAHHSHPLSRLAILACVDFVFDESAMEQLQDLGLVPLLVARLVEYEKPNQKSNGLISSEGELLDSSNVDGEWGSLQIPPSSPQTSSPNPYSTCLSKVTLDTPPSAPRPMAYHHPYHPEPWTPESPILLLLSRFSHVTDPSAALISSGVISGLLYYLTQHQDPSSRCFRMLCRLSCNPNCLQALVRTGSVALIRHHLCQRVGGCEGEERQTDRVKAKVKQLGVALLSNLRVQCESGFGSGVLAHVMLSGTESDKMNCALSLPLISSNKSLLKKLLLDNGGLLLALQPLVSKTGGVSPPPMKKPRLADTCPYGDSNFDVLLLLDDGTRVPANREAVAGVEGSDRVGSEYFRALLRGGFGEAQGNTEEAIHIKDVSTGMLLPVLHYLHGCCLTKTTKEEEHSTEDLAFQKTPLELEDLCVSLLLSCSTKAAPSALSEDSAEKAASKMDQEARESAEENLASRTSELELTGTEMQTENVSKQTKKLNSSLNQTDSKKSSLDCAGQKVNRGLSTTSDKNTIKASKSDGKSLDPEKLTLRPKNLIKGSAQIVKSAAQGSRSSSETVAGGGALAALLPQVYWFSQRYSYPALGRACLSLLLGCQDCPRPFLTSSIAGDCLRRLAREADCTETLKQDLLSLASVALS